MWRMVLRDLQWRRRRFVLAGLATALVFAMTLLLTGLSTSVHNQIERTVDRFDADLFYVLDDAGGPFTTPPRVPVTTADALAAVPGVERAEPILSLRGTLSDPVRDLNVIAQQLDGLGWPEPSEGVRPTAPGQLLVDEQLDLEVGQELLLSGRSFRVVGTADDVSHTFGIPTVFTLLEDAQAMALGGAPLASAVVLQGEPDVPLPVGALLTPDEVEEDMARPLKRGTESIDLILLLLTVTAAGIVGLIVYLSTLEKSADLAVLRATGSTKTFMAVGLALQAILLSLGAAAVAVGLARLLGPSFPVPLEVEGDSYTRLLVLALSVGLVASLAGVWKAVRVDPANAFGAR
jgi:putative ABC transport system permease protein